MNLKVTPTSTLVATKIRNYIKCYSCSKIHCLYSDTWLTLEKTESLQIAKELFNYSCDRPIFLEEHLLATKIWIYIHISCDSPIEWLYYSSRKSSNISICYYCGQDRSLINIPQELKDRFKLMYPMCEKCQLAEKTFFSHMENKVNAKLNKCQKTFNK